MLAMQAGGPEFGSVPTEKLGAVVPSHDSSIGRETWGWGGKRRSRGLDGQQVWLKW